MRNRAALIYQRRMVKPLFLSDVEFPAACPSHSPPKVLGGGYIPSSFENVKDLRTCEYESR